MDIIEKVEGLIFWVSFIVIVFKKFGEVRICVDMWEVNKVIKREKYFMLIIDDFIVDLNGVIYFSILDLFLGYY